MVDERMAGGDEGEQSGDKADWFELTVASGESGRKKRADCRVLGWPELRSRLSGACTVVRTGRVLGYRRKYEGLEKGVWVGK